MSEKTQNELGRFAGMAKQRHAVTHGVNLHLAGIQLEQSLINSHCRMPSLPRCSVFRIELVDSSSHRSLPWIVMYIYALNLLLQERYHRKQGCRLPCLAVSSGCPGLQGGCKPPDQRPDLLMILSGTLPSILDSTQKQLQAYAMLAGCDFPIRAVVLQSQYWKIALLITARGCAFQCWFCPHL